jgi:TetR/AcrR family transcriptional regulator
MPAATLPEEIAVAAGVTEAIIFRHFPNQLALCTAVPDSKHESSGYQDWLAEIRAAMDRKHDAGVLQTLATRIVEAYRRDARFELILLLAALEGHELGLAHHHRLADSWPDAPVTRQQRNPNKTRGGDRESGSDDGGDD